MQDKRLRLPRAFYEQEKTIRGYDEFHAFWLSLVPKLKPYISVDLFYEASMLEFTDVSWSILFLTYNHIAHIVAE